MWDQHALLKDLALYDNESWNDPRDFAKPVNAITLPQDVPSTSDRRLIKLENQVQHLMEAHLAPKKPIQVNKITSSCDICSGPHDTQYCTEIPEQAFVDYASSRTDKAGGKWYTFKPEQNNLGDTYNPSWKFYPNLRTQQPEEPDQTLEDEFKDLHLNLPIPEVLAHAQMYNAILDKYVESLKLGKNGSAFIQGEMPKRIEDPRLFTPMLADGTKSYPVGIVRDVEVHIGRLKLLNEVYVIDMKKDPETPLLVGKGFLATANAVIDCRKAKIAVREGITRSVFIVKGIEIGEEEAPYWTTLGKRESYKPRPSSEGVGARTPYYAKKEFMDCHLLGEWEIARDVEINPFKDVLVVFDEKKLGSS
ncbi:MAK10-like protein [Tanacetum coccineum]